MKLNYNRLISLGSIVALTGFIMSGPVSFLADNILSPQPAWTSAKVFAENYSTIQDIPFYFGFLLIGGMLLVVSAHYLNFKEDNDEVKFHLLIALCWTIIFCTLITFNYICQTTFIHNLALHYKPEYDSAISIFSMSNPSSFCWANEMWGYGFLGISTWHMAGYYRNKNNFIRSLLIANGILSVAGVILTIVDVSWVMTTAGIISYFVWNVLMMVLMIAIYKSSKSLSELEQFLI